MKNKLWLLILFFASNYVFSQFSNVELTRYTINEGLSNSSINSILQTSDGYLWIATKDGLNRFDGQNFKIFKSNPANKFSLPENYVMSLLESRSGELWIGTWGSGLCRYDHVYEKFIKIDHSSKNDLVQCMLEDEDGNIWFGMENNGLKMYDVKKGVVISVNETMKNTLLKDVKNVMGLIEDKDKNIWLATWGYGLLKLNKKENKLEQFLNNVNLNSISNNFLFDVVEESDSTLLICTNSGFDKLNKSNNKIIREPYIEEQLKKSFKTAISRILIDKDGKYWIGTYHYVGLFIADRNKKNANAVIHLLNEYDDSHSLICNRIRYLYKDKLDNIWIGTEDGLNKLSRTKPFLQFKNMPHKKNSLSGRVVSSIWQNDKDILYVGYGGNGFDKIDLNKNSLKYYTVTPPSINGLSGDDVTCLCEDKNGILWIGTSNGGLNRFDSRINSFKSYKVDQQNPFSINSYWIQQILETSDGKLLIGTNDGLQILDRNSEKFYPFDPVKDKSKNRLPKVFSVNSLYEDNDKNIWIGTWLTGLFRYDPNANEVFHYMPDSKSNSISGNKISSIIQSSDRTIWIGTFNNGFNKFDKSSGRFKHYTTSNGLPNDVVFGILEDSKNNLWISTLKGLVKFNPTTENFRIYDVDDGLVNNQFNWHAYFKNKKGEMYFGGINGLVRFNPDSIKTETLHSTVVLTSFKVFNKEAALPRSLPMTDEIVLESDQNFFSIDFTVLDLLPAGKHKYAYMLEGIDPQWVQADSRTTAVYTDIKHGNYKFFVKALNPDCIWGKATMLMISIQPSWWNTWWFRMIVAITVLLILFVGYRIRLNQLLKIEKIRFSIASDLHDEIGSNLSSISVDSQSLMLSPTLTDTEKELSTDISKTAKETVDAMRDIIWFINPKNDMNEDILFKMKQTAAKLLNNIEWTFNASDDVRFDSFNLDVRRNIFLLYKEALTNVVNHSKAKKCTIEISGSPKNFSLSIKDDGVGFDTKNFKASTGIRSMEARAQNIHAKLTLISNVDVGTEVKLLLL